MSVLFRDAVSPQAMTIPSKPKRRTTPDDDEAASGVKRRCTEAARAGGTNTRHSEINLDHTSSKWYASAKQRSEKRRNIPQRKPILWTKEFIESFGVTFKSSRREGENYEQTLRSTDDAGDVGEAKTTPFWDDEDIVYSMGLLSKTGRQAQEETLHALLEELGLVCASSQPKRGRMRLSDAQMANLVRSGGKRLEADVLGLRSGKATAPLILSEGVYGTKERASCIACVHFQRIEAMRTLEAWVGLRDDSRTNVPLALKCEKREQLTKVALGWEDPLLAAVAAALGQRQRERGYKKDADGGWRVHMIGIPERAATVLYFYTATVTEEFLDTVERPWQVKEDASLVITYELLDLREPRRAARLLWEHLYSAGLLA